MGNNYKAIIYDIMYDEAVAFFLFVLNSSQCVCIIYNKPDLQMNKYFFIFLDRLIAADTTCYVMLFNLQVITTIIIDQL